ncbi:hypothetical protein EP12_07985 [Alteromonas australica]|nr:hypothetical protein EP12_07985 [Alteromonas australica]MAF69746.1 DUF3950 domain-containing protein [Alteromonas sp.]|tara:strand:- start:1557 stop:1745 length:189 start_codon:yes stop_codon:yes gene_type:complete
MQEKNNNSSKRSDERKGSTRKNIRFEDGLLERIESDRAKLNQPFSEWVKDACEQKLKTKSIS